MTVEELKKLQVGNAIYIADMLQNDLLNNRYTISKLTEANRLMSQRLHGDNDDNFNC